MAKRIKGTFQVTVNYVTGERLLVDCSAPDIAHRVAMVAAMIAYGKNLAAGGASKGRESCKEESATK